MERILVDKNSNKQWSVKLQDLLVYISSNGGKPKENKFRNTTDALVFAQKQMWKLLKKGYSYSNLNAERLDAAMNIYIGPGYTGYMPIAPIEDSNSFYIAYVLGQFDQENIYKIEEDGSMKLISELPPPSLIFDMGFSKLSNKLYLNANHNILQVNPDTREYGRLSSEKLQYISAFSLSEDRIVWVDGTMLRVTDRPKDLVVWQKKLDIESHKAHSYDVCAGLSTDGKKLAYYTSSENKIILVDLETQQEAEIEKDSDSITHKIYFSADNKTLFIQEAEGAWQIKYYHLEHHNGWFRLSDSGEDTVMESAVDSSHSRIVVSARGLVKVYNMLTQEELCRFIPENTLKYCNVAFLKDYIVTYTDHGCVSLYKI